MTALQVRSFGAQTRSYFDRPHEGAPTGPIEGAAAWRGAEVGDEFRSLFSAADVEELEAAVAAARSRTASLGETTREHFLLPGLAPRLKSWRDEVARGRGFVLLSGLPVERWDEETASWVYWALGLHLGHTGAQNPQGDLLGHVKDMGERNDDPMVRLYRTSADIAYHCDAADGVGLLCLRKARSGGLSRIVSSVRVWNELHEARPDLAARLFEPVPLDLRNEHKPDAPGFGLVPPCRFGAGELRTFYHSDYFRSAQRHADAPMTSLELELYDTYEAIANRADLYLDMDLQPGDVQLLSNHTVLHARTAYKDDPAAPRHLLRLWLSFD